MAPPHAAQTMPLPMPRPPPPLVVPTTSSVKTVRMPISLLPANNKSKRSSTNKFFGKFRSIFRSFPIIVPSCKMPTLNGNRASETIIHGGTRITGTLFGYRKARVNLAFQEDSKCHPFLLLELAIHTGKLLQDMGMGLNRLALECEKHPNDKTKIIDEPIWTLFCNGKKTGYGVKRDPTDDDLNVMQMLHAVSVAVGVLPNEMSDPQDGELSYMRAQFERVIGSKDSETYYMMMPDGNINGPELSVFFVRV
ncbi:protein MIZU-KUSSEI [Trifolium repens]|nr:protein MIZU-KUSSEI [Trifolium repens]